MTPIFVYTNYPSAEIFINGKSQGRQTKDTSVKVFNSGSKESLESFERQKRYRLMWMNTKYEPGTVKVIAYDESGKAVDEKSIHTPGKPFTFRLEADRSLLSPTGKDLSFIRVSIVDKNGNLCSDDTRQIAFKVKGAGSFHAVANGNAISLESFQAPFMKAFSGELTSIVISGEKAGTIVFEASAPGLKTARLSLIVK